MASMKLDTQFFRKFLQDLRQNLKQTVLNTSLLESIRVSFIWKHMALGHLSTLDPRPAVTWLSSYDGRWVLLLDTRWITWLARSYGKALLALETLERDRSSWNAIAEPFNLFTYDEAHFAAWKRWRCGLRALGNTWWWPPPHDLDFKPLVPTFALNYPAAIKAFTWNQFLETMQVYLCRLLLCSWRRRKSSVALCVRKTTMSLLQKWWTWIVQSMNSTDPRSHKEFPWRWSGCIWTMYGPSRLVLNIQKLFHSHVCCIVSNLRRKNAIRRFSLLSASKTMSEFSKIDIIDGKEYGQRQDSLIAIWTIPFNRCSRHPYRESKMDDLSPIKIWADIVWII